jgi:hypothetical protein
MTECPHCHGKGESTGLYCGTGPSFMRTDPCRWCQGSGELDDGEIQRYEQGQAFRTKRIASSESQRDAARRLGVSAIDLSKYEQGLGPLWDEGWVPS